ncbi:hypothetical protein ACMA1I_04255 [Pontibacter sp. 13R65]|uniref:hypothetical protein n=1 Tax=Pontibacter sp. 13R65 TaxID=3127458 RepID=UPI00301BE7F4
MKKYILISVFALISYSGFSQQLKKTDDKLDMAVLSLDLEGYEMASIEMKQELNLTQEQYAQVEQLNKQRYEKLKEVHLAERPEEIQKKINDTTDTALSTILSEDQLQSYFELEGRRKTQFMTDVVE